MVLYNFDNNKIIHNRQMGWTIHAYVDPNFKDYNEVDDIYNMCDNVALLYMWSKLEPEEGKFDFKYLDEAIEKYTKMGKNLHFRISTDPMIYNGCEGVPEWLFEKYHVKYQIKDDYGTKMKFPDYLNKKYLERLSIFLKTLANRYGHLDNLVQIDLRGYGEWGEWHSGYMHKDLKTHHKALKKIIQVWVDAFKDTGIPLALSCSYEWRDDLPLKLHAPKSVSEYLYFQAFDYALKQDIVTFRRDGIGGAIKYYDAELLHKYYQNGKHPICGEFFVAYLESKKRSDGIRGYHIEDALEEAFHLNPNYLMLPWDSVAFYNERQDLVEYGLKRMGYRLVPKYIDVKVDKEKNLLRLRQTWINKACGKLCGAHTLIVRLEDDKNNVIEVKDNTFKPIKILQDKKYIHSTKFDCTNLKGTYNIYFAIVDDKNHYVNLPLDKQKGHFYHVGFVNI